MRGHFVLSLMVFVLCSPALADQKVRWSGPVTDLTGSMFPRYKGPGTRDVIVRSRPWTQRDHLGVAKFQNYRIHDVWNQKGMDIGATRLSHTKWWWYRKIVVRHYDAYRINRDERKFPGLHMDFLRISGAGDHQSSPTNVYLEDVRIRDGDALPIIIQDGWFGTIYLRNVRISDTTLNNVQLSTRNSGRIDRIIVQDSPGLRLALMEGLDDHARVKFVRSPGATLWRTKVAPASKAPMSARVTAVPEPAGVGFVVLGAMLLGRRRR